MADYWKSQERKYCDFCKCWIADNKPSRDFHENGRRHKENVKKRLKNISKNSAKAQRELDKLDTTLKTMEAAALEAYRKDVENNADLTSLSINKRLEEQNLAIASTSARKQWQEAVSKDGRSYYWNVMTNETVWEAPPEGYLTLREQREQQDKQTALQLKAVDKHQRQKALLRMQEEKREEEEERARLAREKLKERRVAEDLPEPVYGPILDPGKNDPYGKWQTITQSEPVDFQLPPPQEFIEIPIVTEPEPVIHEFKQKTIERLTHGETVFKKRKVPTGAKKNTRQKLDDD
ncbi:WW domain-binding protein 4-like isoform X2 [Cylas formicarius]|uniref:WW domain-binding protein 4-like isoform X2 n=1 Tax=Cylas formicarius TaxID=197179 RepID=UPI002958CE5D|nr:WW domain-binding protein 4-like isoform X2 [Cylas formicarius]